MAQLEVNLLCDLKWVVGILETKCPNKADPTWQMTIEEAINNNSITVHLVQLLTHPRLYCTIYSTLLNAVSGPAGINVIKDVDCGSFWPLIQLLAHQNIYITDTTSNSSINHTALASTSPLDQSAHSMIIESIMMIYSSLLAPVRRIVRSIRQVSAFCASKDLPTSLEESVLLWLNKIARASMMKEQQLHQSMLRASDREKYHLKLLLSQEKGAKVITKATDIRCLYDGQSIAAVMVYNAREHLKWNDFYFSHHSLPLPKAESNISKISEFCHKFLPPPSLHIPPDVILNHSHNQSIKCNIIAFVCLLFDYFDSIPLDVKMRKSNTMTATSTPYSYRGTHHVPLNLSSISVPSITSSRDNSTVGGICGSSRSVTDMSDNSSLTLFPGITRNHASIRQNALLSAFIKPFPTSCVEDESHHMIAGPSHVMNHSKDDDHKKRYLITPSAESLNIREEIDHMMSKRKSHDTKTVSCDVVKDDVKLKFVRPSNQEEKLLDEMGETTCKESTTANSSTTTITATASSSTAATTTTTTTDNDVYEKLKDCLIKLENKEERKDESLISDDDKTIIAGKDEYQQAHIRKDELHDDKTITAGEDEEYQPLYLHINVSNVSKERESAKTFMLKTDLQQTVKRIKESMRLENMEEIKKTNEELFMSLISRDKGGPATVEAETSVSIARRPPSPSKGDKKQSKKEMKRKNREAEVKRRLEERNRERKNLLAEKRKQQQEESQKTTVVQGKCNIKLIRNAICYVCLAGEANITLKQSALNELDKSTANHFMVLFRDGVGLKFKGIYSYCDNNHSYVKIYGTGPKVITENMVDKLYKYNSGMKTFQAIPSHTFSISVDGLTIQDHHWNMKRKMINTIT